MSDGTVSSNGKGSGGIGGWPNRLRSDAWNQRVLNVFLNYIHWLEKEGKEIIGSEDEGDQWNRAACIGEDPELFFPSEHNDAFEGKTICNRCPIREFCLYHGLKIVDTPGVWGGTSEKERKTLTKMLKSRSRRLWKERMSGEGRGSVDWGG